MPFPDAPIQFFGSDFAGPKIRPRKPISCFTTTNDKCTFLKNSINVLPKERPEIQSLRPLFMGVTILKKYTPVSYAVMAILMSARGGAVHAADAEEPAVSDESIGEVIVTATRRSENIQNVPIAIQALTSETIKQLNVTTFDDYVKFLPNVTGQGLGPGQNNVYMRGLSTGVTGLQGVGVVGPFPNVAIYLDDQSGQVPGRNLDIYAADLERIEVLEGPQGTLFGAGAQAGVVRYITNKPKLNTTEANFTGGYATTAHGADSNSIEGVLNLPIIEDKFAIRGVVYNETRGGYIDNIPGTFRRGPADLGVGYQYGACPQTPANSTNCAALSNSKSPVTISTRSSTRVSASRRSTSSMMTGTR